MRYLVALLFLIAPPAWGLTPDERDHRFATGVELFDEGQFEKALRSWALIDIENADLSRNRGAAYERLGDNGRAMLHYLRALRLRPDDTAARDGVARIADRREDRLVVIPPSALELAWKQTVDALSLTTWGYLWLASLWLAGLSVGWLLYEPTPETKPLARRLTVAGVALVVVVSIPFGWRAWRFETDPTGVVIAQESVATEEPEGGARQFTLHAGMVGELGERRGGYRRFTAPNGVTGWVKESTVAPVKVTP